MAQADSSGTFGYYNVSPKTLTEFTGQTLFDLITELSALTSLQWDDENEPLNLILKAHNDKDTARVNDILGLMLNVLGLADSLDIEAAFQWRIPIKICEHCSKELEIKDGVLKCPGCGLSYGEIE